MDMDTKEYEFCSSYIGEFLSIINLSPNSEDIDMLEEYREYALIDLEKELSNSPLYEEFVQEINDDYDRKIFDFIKREVALVSPDLFKEKINALKKLTKENKDYATRLGMTLSGSKIDDFYHNYLIALQRVAEADFRKSIM